MGKTLKLIGKGENFLNRTPVVHTLRSIVRHGTGDAESSTSYSTGKQEKAHFQAARRRVSKPTPTVISLPPTRLCPTPTRPHLLVVPIHGLSIFKPPHRV